MTAEPAPCCSFGCSNPSTLVCPECRKLGLPPSHFCSKMCFKAAWKIHKKIHKAIATARVVKSAAGYNSQAMQGDGNEQMSAATELAYAFDPSTIAALPPPVPVVSIEQHVDGVASAMREGAGAWNFKLWPAARVLAKFIELRVPREELAVATVLELGAGTGLTSIVAGHLGARHVCVTDLPCAMPLLRRNLSSNFGAPTSLTPLSSSSLPAPALTASATSNDSSDVSGMCRPTCGDGHGLLREPAECEDYMCETCGSEIEEGADKLGCRVCDFDICGLCGDKAEQGQWSSLPGWYQLQCEAARDAAAATGTGGSHTRLQQWQLPPPAATATAAAADNNYDNNSGTARSALLLPLDFLDSCSVPCLLSVMPTTAPDFVVIADCTFTFEVCSGLVARLQQLRAAAREAGKAQRLLLVHENRTEAVTAHLLKELQAGGISYRMVNTGDLNVHRAEQVMMLEADLGVTQDAGE